MNNRSLAWLYTFLAISFLIWTSFNLWVFSWRVPNELDEFAFVIGNFGMSGVFFWLIYIVIVSFKVLPKVDVLVYPDRVDYFKISDNLVFKVLRMNEYAAAITSKRARRLNPLHTDLRSLPDYLRIPIVVYLYWMILNFAAMIVGFFVLEYFG